MTARDSYDLGAPLADQIIATLADGATAANLHALFNRFFKAESAERAKTQRYAYPGTRYGQFKRNEGLKHIADLLKSVIEDPAIGAEIAVYATGLLARISGDARAAARRLSDVARAATEPEAKVLPWPAMFELMTLLHGRASWLPLAAIARLAAKEVHCREPGYILAFDLIALAEMRQLIRDWRRGHQTSARLDKTIAALGACAEAAPEACAKNRHLYTSLIAALKGDYESAIQHMKHSHGAPGMMFQVFSNQSAHFVAEQTSYRPNTGSIAEIQRHMRHGDDSTPCLMLATDLAAFQANGARLMASYAFWNPGGLLHWHFVGRHPWADGIDSALDMLGKQFDLKINASVEPASNSLDGNQMVTAYRLLPDFLDHYACLVITGTRGAIRAPISRSLSEGAIAAGVDPGAADVWLHTGILNQYQPFPGFLWQAVHADTLAVRNTDAGRLYAAYMADAAQHAAEAGGRQSADTLGTALMRGFLSHRDTISFAAVDGVYSESPRDYRIFRNSDFLFPHRG